MESDCVSTVDVGIDYSIGDWKFTNANVPAPTFRLPVTPPPLIQLERGRRTPRRTSRGLPCREYTEHGYIRVRHGRFMQYEHRLVVSAVLGRVLSRKEHVHHRNGNRHDNRPENLAIVNHLQHRREHSRMLPSVVDR